MVQWQVTNEHANFCSIDSLQKAEDLLKEFYTSQNRYRGGCVILSNNKIRVTR
jgi:hypothetical protein